MPRGGARKGAGRPVGGSRPEHATSRAVVDTREVIREESRARGLNSKARPALDIMRENMMWAHDWADGFLQKCEASYREGAIPQAIDWLNESMKLRKISQGCAEALAPYEAPKLTASVPAPEGAGDAPHAPARTIDHDHLEPMLDRYRGRARDLKVVDGGRKA